MKPHPCGERMKKGWASRVVSARAFPMAPVRPLHRESATTQTALEQSLAMLQVQFARWIQTSRSRLQSPRQTFLECTDVARSKLSHHGSAPRCNLADCPRVSQAEEPATRGDPERSHRKSGFSDTSRPARPDRRPTCRRNGTNAYRLVDSGDDAYRWLEVVGQSAHHLPIIQKAAVSGSARIPSGARAGRLIACRSIRAKPGGFNLIVDSPDT